MFSYEFYRVVHFTGLLMLFMSVGGLMLKMWSVPEASFPQKRIAMMTHGIGSFLSLLGGFGLLARLGMIGSWPIWVYLKILIWLIIVGSVFPTMRRTALVPKLWFIVIIVGVTGAYLARYKPF